MICLRTRVLLCELPWPWSWKPRVTASLVGRICSLHFVSVLWAYAVPGAVCCQSVPGASSHGRLGFFKCIVSAGTGTVFGMEHGWCGVANKIRVEG